MKPLHYLALLLITAGASVFAVLRFQQQNLPATARQTVIITPYAAAHYQGAAYANNVVRIAVFARLQKGKDSRRVLIAEMQPQELTGFATFSAAMPQTITLPAVDSKTAVVLETEVSYDYEGTVLTLMQRQTIDKNGRVHNVAVAV